MIHETFAAKIPASHRKDRTCQYLQEKRNAKDADVFRSNWAKDSHSAGSFNKWERLAIPTAANLEKIVALIPNAWAIQFTFTLASPYLSKGIEAFDLLDNPIIRDKVYEVPIVPASSWKGAMHVTEEKHERIIRLFGNEQKSKKDFKAGRLRCFPTGFKETKCEVINPHDRARRVGTNPILLECVPEGQEGTFTVLYIPFGDENTPQTARDDLKLCVQAIHDLLLQWGIGAKKSNGNGLVKDAITSLYLAPLPQSEDNQEPQQPVLPEECKIYESRFGIDYQSVKPKDWKSHDGATREEYKRARDNYQHYQSDLEVYQRKYHEWEQHSQEPSQISVIKNPLLTQLTEIVEVQIVPILMKGNN
jgi:CRISPR-associated protein Cmr2